MSDDHPTSARLRWQDRTLVRIKVRIARWNLSSVDLVDPRTGTHLGCVLPLDKAKNADGRRRVIPTTAVVEPRPRRAESPRTCGG